jgi:isopenicillin N synthase-like dioxygenase
MTIPTIDLSDARAATKIREACERIGFFLIAEHGVPAELLARTYDSTRRFFDQPLAEKLKVKRPSAAVSRGYDMPGALRLAGTLGVDSPPDLQEVFVFGPPRVGDSPYYRDGHATVHFAPNLWPEEPAAFKADAIAYYDAMTELAARLMRLFAVALYLPEDFFADKIDRHISSVRLINYPEQPDAPATGQLRAGAHSDYGSLTILKVDDAPGGLQARDRSERWIDIAHVPGTLVVNLGDLMMQWTNDRWVSTLHRVVNPPRDQALGSRRTSLAFFHQPNYDARIECLPACCQDRPAKYPPTTSGAHWRAKNLSSRAPATAE